MYSLRKIAKIRHAIYTTTAYHVSYTYMIHMQNSNNYCTICNPTTSATGVLNAIRTVCLCSFVSPPVEAKLRAEGRNCNATCAGGKENVCGDRDHYSVFATGLKTSRVPGNHYLGCYEETDVYRAFKKKKSVEFPYVNTPNICSKHCDRAGYEYFQLSSRESCFCGNSHPADDGAIRVDDNQCSTQCSGDANKYCGGAFKIAAFRIGKV